METTNTTLTTAAAWRAAISLTCADVRSFIANVFYWAKVITAFVYLFLAVVLVFNESETLLPNFAGMAMLAVGALYVKRNNK